MPQVRLCTTPPKALEGVRPVPELTKLLVQQGPGFWIGVAAGLAFALYMVLKFKSG